MSINYAWQKFHGAVYSALLADEPIRERLEHALRGLHTLNEPDDLPPELQKRFDAMMTVCTGRFDAVMTGKLQPIAMTVQKMDDAEATMWLKEILSLYDEVTKLDAIEQYVRYPALRPILYQRKEGVVHG